MTPSANPGHDGGTWRDDDEPGVPLFMNVTLTIDPERVDQFLAALREVHRRSHPVLAGRGGADP